MKVANKTKNKIGFDVSNANPKTTKGKSGKGKVTGKELGFKGGTYFKNKLTVPKDTERKDKLSIVFFDSKVLNKITEMCIPQAKGSEFQVHYRAIAVHIEKDGFEVVITIPTAFYNFKQEVSISSVDYDLNDIDNEAESAKEDSEKMTSHLLKELPFFNALTTMGYDVSFKEGDLGSIHRHPGRFGFSSIDLGKNPEFPGVIYRNKIAKDKFQTDSVMYISGKECEIYTTEARLVNTKEASDGGVEGDYCEIPTISVIRPDEASEKKKDDVSKVLGDIEDDIFSKFHFVGAFGAEVKKYPMLEIILEMLYEMDYPVSIDNVKPERITQYFAYLNKNKAKGKKSVGNDYAYWDDLGGYGNVYADNGFGRYDEWDDYGWYNDGFGAAPSKVTDYETLEDMVKFMLEYHGVEYNQFTINDICEVLENNFTIEEQFEIIDFSVDSHKVPEAQYGAIGGAYGEYTW